MIAARKIKLSGGSLGSVYHMLAYFDVPFWGGTCACADPERTYPISISSYATIRHGEGGTQWADECAEKLRRTMKNLGSLTRHIGHMKNAAGRSGEWLC